MNSTRSARYHRSTFNSYNDCGPFGWRMTRIMDRAQWYVVGFAIIYFGAHILAFIAHGGTPR